LSNHFLSFLLVFRLDTIRPTNIGLQLYYYIKL